ncbi:MAG: hypothetical protein P1V20_28485 [Verrucomicrobiales bacterium]|nr:hypothetical protein [Verrucomicrobiales bacterium]
MDLKNTKFFFEVCPGNRPAVLKEISRKIGQSPIPWARGFGKARESVRAYCIALIMAKIRFDGRQDDGDLIVWDSDEDSWVKCLAGASSNEPAWYSELHDEFFEKQRYLKGYRGVNGAPDKVVYHSNLLPIANLIVLITEGRYIPNPEKCSPPTNYKLKALAKQLEEEGGWGARMLKDILGTNSDPSADEPEVLDSGITLTVAPERRDDLMKELRKLCDDGLYINFVQTDADED